MKNTSPCHDRRSFSLGLLALAGAAAMPARAQEPWPGGKPIRLVLPFSAGGPGDTNVRAMAQAQGKRLNQTIIVDNRPGAGGIIGSENVAKSAPDGYTWLSAGNGAIANALLRPKMPYAESDLVPVVGTSTAPSVLVTNAGVPVQNLKELQAWARAKGRLNFGTAGSGSTGHFVAEMVESALGVPVTLVHYKSGSQTVNAIVGGEVDLASEAPIGVAAFVQSGKLRALALAARERTGPLKQVPTTVEQGFPTILMQHWGGIFAPKATPTAILDRIAEVTIAAYKEDADLVAQTERGGAQPMLLPRAAFERFLQEERARMAQIVTASHMTLE
ncbi:tripartite-type tricarboxylate transporter receptor subunit TctC [Variovorax sp. W1I1]|uniref:tripartite tricarboxylate transporter substrate binding protein n=1 Tax=Variovorax sp. W1I1 TaxID=3042309 RepID=UPI002788FD41|nr:tripartite tricarboxylate transporter substrate binding protein [Variovorax sp. W1I1]MDQ0610937.1 tripartite-type tricarboxylate transporter receptor subunit TctC [Variovorax sp. W1I1]